jgi:hypothetical protein
MVDTATVIVPEAGPEAPKPEAKANERPAWLPEKFKSPEDMAAAYAALESKQSGKPVEASEDTSQDTPPADSPKAKPDTDEDNKPVTQATYGAAVDAALTTAGMSPAEVAAEWADNGKLSDETFDKLEEAGFSRQIVDTYVKGFEQQVNGATAESDAAIVEVAGGKTEYEALINWAGSNLTVAEATSFNKVLDAGDVGITRLAVQGLMAKRTEVEGREPKLNFGGTPGGSDTYSSWAEQSKAMNEARKSGDPAKIKAVEAKSMRSSL